MRPAIRFDDVTLGYDRHPAVHHLTGEIAEGSLTALVGPNGGGKSTLLKGVTGALTPLGGRIDLGGFGRHDIAYLPQIADIDRSFPLSVFDLVAMGLWKRTGLFGGTGKADRARVSGALATVGLRGFEARPIGTLSGGQMQRALFARLLLQEARVILLDEPFTAIDSRTVEDLVHIIEHWHAEGRTVLAVLHDLDLVRRHFPHSLLLAREAVAWGPTATVLTAENLFKARHMVEAFDPHAHACAREVA
jgi:zinc/manganese transport system ATP-binding protein